MGICSDRFCLSEQSQVILQGTPLNYNDATILDKLEYAFRVGGSATERHLSQPNALSDIAVSEAISLNVLAILFLMDHIQNNQNPILH